MKTREEFNAYYDSVITAQLERLKELRHTLEGKKMNIRLYLLGVLGVIFCVLVFISGSIGTILLIAFAFLSPGIFSQSIKKESNRHEYYLKDNIIEGLIHFINPYVSYEPERGIPQQGFDLSGIFRETRDYFSSDEIDGFAGDTHIKFSYVKADMRNDRFEGLFFVLTINKPFTNEIYVCAGGHSFIGQVILETIHYGRPRVVRLDDQYFNSAFTVFSNNPDEAAYIIDQDLRDNIIRLSEITGKEINLSFVRDRLFLSIATGRQLLQPQSYTDPGAEEIYEWFHWLNLALNVPDILGLNDDIMKNRLL